MLLVVRSLSLIVWSGTVPIKPLHIGGFGLRRLLRVVEPKGVRSATQNSNCAKGVNIMKPGIGVKDEVKGNVHELKGAVKEKAGQLMNDPDMEVEGKVEKIAGKVQKKIGQVEKAIEKR